MPRTKTKRQRQMEAAAAREIVNKPAEAAPHERQEHEEHEEEHKEEHEEEREAAAVAAASCSPRRSRDDRMKHGAYEHPETFDSYLKGKEEKKGKKKNKSKK